MKVNSTRKSKFAKIDDYSKSLSIDDEKLKSKYNSQIIQLAQKLKYQHERILDENGNPVLDENNQVQFNSQQAFSDEYYLEYACKELVAKEITELSSRFKKISSVSNSIPDPKWSGFTYEEIIQMSESGTVVPEEVLAWAYGQRETDLGYYISISTDAENNPEDRVDNDSDPSVLEKKVLEFTKKSESSIQKIEKKLENLKNTQNAIRELKDKNKSSQAKINETKNLTEELQTLEEKKKSKSLTKEEKSRYKKLKAQINSNKSEVKEIQRNNKEIENFLTEIDLLKAGVEESDVIAQDTNNAIKNWENTNASTRNKLSVSALKSRAMISDSDIIMGVSKDYIPTLALDTVKNLEITINNAEVNTSDQNEYVSYSKEYAKGTKEILQMPETNNNDEEVKVDNTDSRQDAVPTENNNEDLQNPVNEEDNNEQESENVKSGFMGTVNNMFKMAKNDPGILPDSIFGFLLPGLAKPEFALLMTVSTIASKLLVKTSRDEQNKATQELGQDVKQEQKESKKLDKTTKETEKILNSNNAEKDVLLLKLDQLVQKLGLKTQPEEASQEDSFAGNEQSNPLAEQEETTSEMENVSARSQQLADENTQAVEDVKSSIPKHNKLRERTGQDSKGVKLQDNIFQKLASGMGKLADNTQTTGIVTTAMGTQNMAVAMSLMSTALSMMSNPFTMPLGQTLLQVSSKWIIISSAELLTGPSAIMTAGIGYEEKEKADEQSETTEQVSQDETSTDKESKQTVKYASEVAGEDFSNEGPSTNNENAQNSDNQENESTPTEVKSYHLSQPEQENDFDLPEETVNEKEPVIEEKSEDNNPVKNNNNQEDENTPTEVKSYRFVQPEQESDFDLSEETVNEKEPVIEEKPEYKNSAKKSENKKENLVTQITEFEEIGRRFSRNIADAKAQIQTNNEMKSGLNLAMQTLSIQAQDQEFLSENPLNKENLISNSKNLSSQIELIDNNKNAQSKHLKEIIDDISSVSKGKEFVIKQPNSQNETISSTETNSKTSENLSKEADTVSIIKTEKKNPISLSDIPEHQIPIEDSTKDKFENTNDDVNQNHEKPLQTEDFDIAHAIMKASASSSLNANNNDTSSDKTEKKLVRFNDESMKDLERKRKKVMKVSSLSTKNGKK